MKYICEIEVEFDHENDRPNELYCSQKECGYIDYKKSRHGLAWRCNLFNTALKLEKAVIYEYPGVLRCKTCRDIFYPAPQEN